MSRTAVAVELLAYARKLADASEGPRLTDEELIEMITRMARRDEEEQRLWEAARKSHEDYVVETAAEVIAGRDELSGSKAGQKGATKRRAKLRRVGK